MGRVRVAVAALVVAGVVLVGVGTSGYVRGKLCEESTVVAAATTDAEPAVDHADLPPGDRAVVATVVGENRTVLTGDVGLANGTVVGYEGSAHRIALRDPADCGSTHPVGVQLPLGLGGGAVLIGLVAAGFITVRENDRA